MKNALSLLCNLAIVVWTALSVRKSVVCMNEQGERARSAVTFRYFTTDSNLLAALAALAVLPYNIAALAGGALALPAWAVVLKYAGTVAVCVTLVTVVAFLGPTQGYRPLFAGYGLYLHLVGPLLAALSFGLMETGAPITWPQTLWGLLPTLVYGSVYLLLVVFLGAEKTGWEDFYGFNKNGKWPASFLAMHAATYALCVALRALHNAALW